MPNQSNQHRIPSRTFVGRRHEENVISFLSCATNDSFMPTGVTAKISTEVTGCCAYFCKLRRSGYQLCFGVELP